jgi:O-acetyl-ADP-ribose deacetylase (regulator of RNase III)
VDLVTLHRVGDANVLVGVGDLTRQPVDAVVNAANERLSHGGGVAAAIVRTGGRVIQEESDAWVRQHGPVGRGGAAVTTGGMLQAPHVIHVVGPRYAAGQDNPGILRDAVTAALDAAASIGARSVAFPAISTGIFGYPGAEAATVIAAAVVSWLDRHPGEVDEVRLVGFSRAAAEHFAAALTP